MSEWPLDDLLRLFVRGVEHTLRDLRGFERQVVLIRMHAANR
ncbi:hypothetical protein [Mesorhizobium sp. WSM3862]|nr:hypothetical protein [Mesorhizobium sp. WSM3862]